jgi:D-cysteine desulfhydrase family pyridoxal phosphate-dependent enzyme
MNQPALMPRVRLASLPTTIQPLPRLSAALRGPRLLVKRDDLTGLAFGGNKTRKLEYVLAEAQAHGARTLITLGAAQSNHCRQTAAAAAKIGLDCILVLSGSPDQDPSGNLLLDHLFGAEIVWTSYEERPEAVQRVFQTAWQDGKRPYLIPLGASNALGTLAYEAAFREFLQQPVSADWIVTASSSGGTQAGLALGAKRSGWGGRILGISIDEPQEQLQQTVSDLCAAAAERLEEQSGLSPADILVNADFLGEGYGVMGAAEIEAIRIFAETEGLLLDPVYTARAAAGLIALIRQGFFHPDETVLFWHTGGTPALFAETYTRHLK